jgi:hypothetical protein
MDISDKDARRLQVIEELRPLLDRVALPRSMAT